MTEQTSFEPKAINPVHKYLSGVAGDTGLGFELYRRLHNDYPQINDKTRVEIRVDRTVEIALSDLRLFRYTTIERVPGWRGKIWRIVGELFSHPVWINKGYFAQLRERVLPPVLQTLEFKGYHYEIPYGPSRLLRGAQSIRFYVAYDGLHDVLYFHR